MYLLINPDQTISLAGNHPMNETLNTNGLTLVELPDQTVADVMGTIPIEEALWHADTKTVSRHPVFAVGSEAWRRRQAALRIQQCYPFYKQLNILRSSDKAAKKKMVVFIDQCRAWSNDAMSDPTLIEQIVP
jgi:hypothetical protein